MCINTDPWKKWHRKFRGGYLPKGCHCLRDSHSMWSIWLSHESSPFNPTFCYWAQWEAEVMTHTWIPAIYMEDAGWDLGPWLWPALAWLLQHLRHESWVEDFFLSLPVAVSLCLPNKIKTKVKGKYMFKRSSWFMTIELVQWDECKKT